MFPAKRMNRGDKFAPRVARRVTVCHDTFVGVFAEVKVPVSAPLALSAGPLCRELVR